MAPEQVRGEPLDGRTDLFAMAALLFEMLSGQLAFAGATMVDVLHAVLHGQPPALSGGAAVAGLDRVIHKALQKQPADRYESAAAMAAAIRVIAAGDSSEMSAPGVRPMTRLIALPFRVLRPDAETDFLAFSLPDAITSSLAGTRNLLVRSSAAAARFDPQAPDLRKLAADADVDVALMGTILRAGNQLRATAQLVEAPAGTVVWSHAAQHPLQDVFTLQDELVGGIVASLSQSLGDQASRVGRRDVPRSAEAYELYLRGNELARDWDRIPEAREVYQRCVALDSQFAPAWAGPGPLPAGDREVPAAAAETAEAERSFQRAQSLNPDLPVLHKYLRAARVRRRSRGRRDAAAAATGPGGGRSGALRGAGPCLPLHRLVRRVGGRARGSQAPRPDHPDQRAQHLQPAVRLASGSSARPPTSTATSPPWRCTEWDAKPKPWRPGRACPSTRLPTMKLWDDSIRACLTDAPDARDLVERLAEFGSWGDPEGYMAQGIILSRLGGHDLALGLLAEAQKGGFTAPDTLAEDPWLAPLRTDPRFAGILQEARRSAAKRWRCSAPRAASGCSACAPPPENSRPTSGERLAASG